MVDKVMGSLMGAKPKTDPAVAELQRQQNEKISKQEADVAAEKKTLQQKSNAALNATRERRAGYRSLISIGGETGVNGGNAATRATLG